MKRFNIYLLFFILSISSSVYGQLDEFLIQAYLYTTRPANHTLNSFLSELKNTYKFNSVLINTDDSLKTNGEYAGLKNVDHIYKAAGDMDLNIVGGNNTGVFMHGSTSIFNPTAAEKDIQKYSGAGSSYRNIIGYNVQDEPLVEYVEVIAPAINFLKNHEDTKNLLRYANLLPAAVYEQKELRENYIQKYIDTSSPNLISFDHYPIYDKNDRFFHSLYSFALKSVENSIPFIYVLTPFKKGEDFYSRNPPATNTMGKSHAEFNYVIYCALAYGAKGISYWPGLTHVRNMGDYKFELNFESGVLNHVKSLHAMMTQYSDILLSLNFASAYHASSVTTLPGVSWTYESIKEPFTVGLYYFNKDPFARRIFTDYSSPFYSSTSLPIYMPNELLITFMEDNVGQPYCWVVNKSLSKTHSLKGFFNGSVRDVLNGGNILTSNSVFLLGPGEGKLFTPISTSKILVEVTNRTYGSELGAIERGDIISMGISSGTPNVIFESGAIKSFVGNEIRIYSAQIKEGSLVRMTSNTASNVKSGSPRAFARTVSYAPTSISDAELTRDQAYISPNPILGDQINLHLDLEENEEADVIIYDSMGNMIKRLRTSENENYIPLESALPGIYFVHVNQTNGSCSLKVIKN